MSDNRPHRPEAGEMCKRRHWLTVAAAIAVLAVTVIGCGNSAQGVSGPGTDQRPAMVAVLGDGTSFGPAAWKSPSLQTTQRISARSGGTIVCGRHTLQFWPRALAQDTDITLVEATGKNGFVSAECYPEGLKFNAKVTLESDFSDICNPAGYVMLWLVDGPGGLTFVNLGGHVSPNGKGIITDLEHFSVYAPAKLLGKGGW